MGMCEVKIKEIFYSYLGEIYLFGKKCLFQKKKKGPFSVMVPKKLI